MDGWTDNSTCGHTVCVCVCVHSPRLCGGWACHMPPRTLGALSGTEFRLCVREGGRWLSSRLVRASGCVCRAVVFRD